MNKKHAINLLKAAAFVETLKPQQLKMQELISEGEKCNGTTCGTVCCVVGWAPAYLPRSMQWRRTEHGSVTIRPAKGYSSCYFFTFPEAARRLFGLKGNDVDKLLNVKENTGEVPGVMHTKRSQPKTVAKNLRKWVEDRRDDYQELLAQVGKFKPHAQKK